MPDLFPPFHPHSTTPLFEYPINRTEEDPLTEFANVYETNHALELLTQQDSKLPYAALLVQWACLNYFTSETFRERLPFFTPKSFKLDMSCYFNFSKTEFSIPFDTSKFTLEAIFNLLPDPTKIINIPVFNKYCTVRTNHINASKSNLPEPQNAFTATLDPTFAKEIPPNTPLYFQRTSKIEFNSTRLHWGLLNRSVKFFAVSTPVNKPNNISSFLPPSNLITALKWEERPYATYASLPLTAAFQALGACPPSPDHKATLTALKKRVKTELPRPRGPFKVSSNIPHAYKVFALFKEYYNHPIFNALLPFHVTYAQDSITLYAICSDSTLGSSSSTFILVKFPSREYFNLKPVDLLTVTSPLSIRHIFYDGDFDHSTFDLAKKLTPLILKYKPTT